MLEFIKNNAGKIKRNLISLDNQPIGKAALTVIFLLDIFILISIFNGLADHTKQLATPSQLIPQYCRDIVIEGNWNQTNRLDRLAQQISITKGSYYRRDKRERTRERHLVCKPISNLFFSIEDDKNLSKELIEYQRVQREIRQLNAELERTKNSYDTSLLEKMVDQEKEQTDISSIRNDIARKTTAIEKLVIKRKSLESSLLQNSEISKLFSMLDGFTEDDRISLRDDLR
ncbi:MAG: zinc ribbon domain-containing protein, partial [Gammaproteobacteria bacterium]